MRIEVPDQDDTPNNMLTYDNYRRAVLAIRENPNAAYLPNCIICRGQHRFENCPTLNDHDFLKQHYIRFCQNVRRDQTKLSQQRTEPINFMDREYFDDDEESDSDQDFHYGRRQIRCSAAIHQTSSLEVAGQPRVHQLVGCLPQVKAPY